MFPNCEKENILEQIEELFKTNDKQMIINLIKNKISDAFIYGIESGTHSSKFLKLNGLPFDTNSYLKYKGL